MNKKLSADLFQNLCEYGLLALWASLFFSSALTEISFVFALLTCALWKFKTRDFSFKIDNAVLLPLMFYLVWIFLSIFWSDIPSNSFRGILKVTKQALTFLMAAQIFHRENARNRWEIIFIIFFAVLVADSWCQYFTGRDFLRHIASQDSGAGMRLSASFKTYGLLGSYLISTLPILFFLGLRYRNYEPKQWNRWLVCLALLVAGLPILFLTKSRGAILAFLLGIFFLTLCRKKILYLLLVTGIIAGCFIILPKTMLIHLNMSNKEQSLLERHQLWRRATEVIDAKPVTGTGINTYASAHQKYDKIKNWRVQNYYAHNGYLQMAAEIGLVGLAFFLIFLGAFFRSTFPPLNAIGSQKLNSQFLMPLGIFLGIFNFLIFAGIDTVLHNPQPVMTFWYMLGLATAYKKKQNQSCR